MINFVIIAWVLFLVVKRDQPAQLSKEAEKPAKPAETPPRQEVLLAGNPRPAAKADLK